MFQKVIDITKESSSYTVLQLMKTSFQMSPIIIVMLYARSGQACIGTPTKNGQGQGKGFLFFNLDINQLLLAKINIIRQCHEDSCEHSM